MNSNSRMTTSTTDPKAASNHVEMPICVTTFDIDVSRAIQRKHVAILEYNVKLSVLPRVHGKKVKFEP